MSGWARAAKKLKEQQQSGKKKKAKDAARSEWQRKFRQGFTKKKEDKKGY